MSERRLLWRRVKELEPLAYVYERNKSELFRICHDLHREYKALYESLLRQEMLS